jgi:hypothetical protein
MSDRCNVDLVERLSTAGLKIEGISYLLESHNGERPERSGDAYLGLGQILHEIDEELDEVCKILASLRRRE